MPAHDIIDNRTEKLVDRLSEMLGTSERARFAVGYLFLSGLTSVAKRLLSLKELRLLIGNTTNRETVLNAQQRRQPDGRDDRGIMEGGGCPNY